MDEKLNLLICEIFNAEPGQLDASVKLRDLDEWDSLRHMEFVVALETEFSFELNGDEIAGMETLEDFRNMTLRKTQAEK